MAKFKNNVLSLENNISGFDCRDNYIEYSEHDGTKVLIQELIEKDDDHLEG